jgi:signal transduction histidine kinase
MSSVPLVASNGNPMISTARSPAPTAAGLRPAAEAAAPAPAAPQHRRHLAKLLVPLLIGNGLVVALCMVGLHLLSAARGYVGGESRWSKGHAIASVELRAYAATEDPSHLAAFRAALDVPLADREAREIMERPELDDEARRALERAFERGGIVVADQPGMVRLFRWFGDSPLMAPSLDAWRRGDELVAEMLGIGQHMQQLAEAPHGPEHVGERLLLMQRLDRLDGELRALELRFSDALAESSRNAFLLIATAIGVVSGLLTLATVALIVVGVRQHNRDAQALAVSNRRWTLAAQAAGIGLAEWATDSDEIHLDARACAIYGLTSPPQGRMLSRTELRNQLDPRDFAAMDAAFARAASEEGVLDLRYRIRVDGQLRHLELTGQRHTDNENDISAVVAVLRDVSDQVRQEQIALEKAAAERAAKARVEFLSRLSHELRTPLNAVLGFSELLQMDPKEPLSERQQQRVQLIAGAGVHLLRLVDDVLDISGIDAGHFKLQRIPTALEPVIHDALGLNGDQYRNGTQIEIGPLRPGLAAWADAQRLNQVLVNLLSNACKYNRPGGCVRLTVEETGKQVDISVRDEGPGMTEAEIKQLFQPFKRLPSGADKPGTGLGLTIVKMLAEQMGGGVTVQSVPGRGTVFTVHLEAATLPEAVSPASIH